MMTQAIQAITDTGYGLNEFLADLTFLEYDTTILFRTSEETLFSGLTNKMALTDRKVDQIQEILKLEGTV